MPNLYTIYAYANTIGGIVALVGGLVWLRRQDQQRQQQA